MRPRASIVTNVLAQYRVPCLRELAARLPGQVHVFLLAETMADREYIMGGNSRAPGARLREGQDGMPVEVLPGMGLRRRPFDDLHLNDVRAALEGYDLIVLGGWDEPSYLLLWGLARAMGKRVGFWIESTLADGSRATRKEAVKRALLRGAAGAVVPGASAAAYCEWLGLARARIFTAPNAVDSAWFRARADELGPRRSELRQKLGLDGVVILFAGRMVEFYKRVSVLLAAQAQLEREQLPAQLVLVGEGPDRSGYEELARREGLTRVRFEKFMEHAELAEYYAAADIFVLPSRSEVWGFVLNEAMEFGLPLVTTTAVGAAADLVHAGENGLVVAPDDAQGLAQALAQLVKEEERRRQYGARSREIVGQYTPAAWAAGFARGLEAMWS